MAVDEKRRRSSEIRVDLTPRESHEFVKKVARDDGFRAALRERPQEVLREHGIEIDETLVPSQVKLPTPEDLEKLLDEMAELDVYASAPRSVIWPVRIWRKIREIIRRPRK